MKDNKKDGKLKTIFASVSSEEKMSGKLVAFFVVLFALFVAAAVFFLNFMHNMAGDHRGVEFNKNSDSVVSEPFITNVPDDEPKVTVSEYMFNTQQLKQYEYDQLIEAEDADGSWSLTEADHRPGYSGTGYLTDFSLALGNSLSFGFDIPARQHYDISICFASDEVMKNEVLLDGENLFDFECTEETTGRFVIKTYYGVFLEEGRTTLTVHEIEAGFDLDYIRVCNNKSIYSSKTDIPNSLVNPDASAEAKELMKYLTDNFGKRIITGQYASDAENKELKSIYDITSNYPAIRFGDMSQYSVNASEPVPAVNDEVSAALRWAEQGGIVGYIWHWKAPLYENEFYSEKTDFDLALAVTDIDVSLLSMEKIEQLHQEGVLTAETVRIVQDIDNISQQLVRLRDKNVPVLWRPLHEASGDWFWWGDSGPECYKWLWNLLYRRQTKYHKLNNLIWIWSAQGSDYFVGNSAFDIASVDLYTDNTDNTSYYKQYQWLYSLTGGQKLIALSECGSLPDLELTFRDRAVWSFFGLWYGEYLLDKEGNLSEQYNSRDTLIKMYNANRTVTLEKYKTKSELREEPPVTEPPVTTPPVTQTSPVTTTEAEEEDEYEEEEYYEEEYDDYDYDYDEEYYEDDWY